MNRLNLIRIYTPPPNKKSHEIFASNKIILTFAPAIREMIVTIDDDFVAQLVEQMTLNHWVEGSIPSEVTKG